MPKKYAVIGAGIVGAAVANELTKSFPDADVTVFEKEAAPATHQSGHNSGVVHAGLYYEPGSLKATLCRRGVHLLQEYSAKNGLPYDECGKILVSQSPEEDERLRAIHDRAVANGVPGVRLLRTDEIEEVEPNVVGRLALHSPETAIIDYAAVTKQLINDITSRGGKVHFNTEVTGFDNKGTSCTVLTDKEQYSFDRVVVCAGLQSDRLAKKAGGSKYPRIVPFFGQYQKLPVYYGDITKGLVYPVPDPAYPFLGVHLTKHISGDMLIGPNAFLSLGRENYAGWKINVRDVIETLLDVGFWKFAAKNVPATFRELGAIIDRQGFVKAAIDFVPKVDGATSKPITRGIRAQAMDKDGGLVDDFKIELIDSVILLRNAPSPGATSSLALGEHIVKEYF